VYSDFDAALRILVKEERIEEYPNLCAEVTSRFSILSSQIIGVKVSES
jgi:hypothetical protein